MSSPPPTPIHTHNWIASGLHRSVKAGLLFAFTLLTFAPDAFAQSLPAAKGPARVLVPAGQIDYLAPVWSPDGRSLAFSSTGFMGIWVSDAEGGNVRQVAEGASGFGFQWSLDSGSILARVSREEDRRKSHSLRIYDIVDGSESELTPYRPSMPSLPVLGGNGSMVLLPGRDRLEVLASGLAPVSLAKGEDQTRGDASPGVTYLLIGNRIAKATIPSLEPTPGQPQEDLPAESDIEYLSPFPDDLYLNLEVSPDGSKLAFEVYGGSLYVMNTDGSGLTELGRANRPTWSPDSRFVAAMVAEDDGYRINASDIVVYSVDGLRQVNLTEESDLIAMHPDWSPSGAQIVFDSQRDGAIYVLDLIVEE